MKVFIHYQDNAHSIFDGARMRKTLKGACEEVGINWVDSPQEKVEIAHFLSPNDLNLAIAEKKKGIKIVVSAFYCEADPNASFFKELWNGQAKMHRKAIKLLEVADLILVPSEGLKQFLARYHFKENVRVLRPSVNLSRFARNNEDSVIFPRYFGLKPRTKTVIAAGSYGDKKTLNFIKNVAKACPKIEFFFFGSNPKHDIFGILRTFAGIHRPENLHLQKAIQDDIYRSGILNSIAYISNDSERPDAIRPLEGFAAKTQVVVIGQPHADRQSKLLQPDRTCYYFDTPKKMGKYLLSLSSGSAPSTTLNAYLVAKNHSLPNFGKILKTYYEELLEAKGE